MSLLRFHVQRYDELQAEEVYDAQLVADYAAQVVGDGSTDRMSAPQRADWIYRTTAYLRRRFAAWRIRAKVNAGARLDEAIEAGYAGAFGCYVHGQWVAWPKLDPERRWKIASELANAAIAGYEAYLGGTTPIGPGDYLEIVKEAETEDASNV